MPIQLINFCTLKHMTRAWFRYNPNAINTKPPRPKTPTNFPDRCCSPPDPPKKFQFKLPLTRLLATFTHIPKCVATFLPKRPSAPGVGVASSNRMSINLLIINRKALSRPGGSPQLGICGTCIQQPPKTHSVQSSNSRAYFDESMRFRSVLRRVMTAVHRILAPLTHSGNYLH